MPPFSDPTYPYNCPLNRIASTFERYQSIRDFVAHWRREYQDFPWGPPSNFSFWLILLSGDRDGSGDDSSILMEKV
ncbi:MAG TPA: hypothetical protein EYP19_14385 [Desulfobacterales bacterium]|nr:hypothetical protein [Desulfobacterales bacterium]